MLSRRALGRQFGWLWAAYAVSAYGSGFGFGAFGVIAILVLHAGAAEVSGLAAAGLAAGAAVAVPLGPWVEFRRKRPVLVAMDLTRFAALMSIPAAYALGWLSFAQCASRSRWPGSSCWPPRCCCRGMGQAGPGLSAARHSASTRPRFRQRHLNKRPRSRRPLDPYPALRLDR
jgi:hypothetical protein